MWGELMHSVRTGEDAARHALGTDVWEYRRQHPDDSQAFDAAMSGESGIVVIAGEPGIGKTALCSQLMAYASELGGRALVGHCYE